MPRGVKKTIDYAEELRKIDASISELQAKRDALLQKKREGDLKLLSTFLEQHSLTAEDAISILSPAVAAASQKPSECV